MHPYCATLASNKTLTLFICLVVTWKNVWIAATLLIHQYAVFAINQLERH
jgi:hypothetical protein